MEYIHKESAECNELPSVQCSCACLKVLIYTIRTTNSPSGQHISIKEFIYLIATYMLKNTSTEFAGFFLLKKKQNLNILVHYTNFQILLETFNFFLWFSCNKAQNS